MRDRLYKKSLAVTIICLFVGAGVVPSISSDVSSFNADNTLYVDVSGLGNYSSIQAEIDDAYYGDTGKSEFSPPKIFAFYYGWYGDETEDWYHWDSPNPVGHTTWYLPLLGVYSSLNRSVIEQHVEWAQYAGIDGFIFSWWHNDFELEHFKKGLEILLSVAMEKNFKVSVYLETEGDHPVADQINYLMNRGYCDSPAWYYKDGKPVFYVWAAITSNYPGARNQPNGYWSYVRSRIAREIYLNLCWYPWPYEGDALHDYILDMKYDDFRLSLDFLNFLSDIKYRNKGDYSLPVNPGFEDMDGDIQVPRHDGERYRAQWEAVLNLSTEKYQYPGYYADEILITSWNEWHESTSIEPAFEWGLEYLNITAFYAINRPPDKPLRPSGPTSGKPETNYTYNTSTNDSQGEQVYYLWDWGDGSFSEWLGPCYSGSTIGATYAWQKKGEFAVRVKARDTRGAESPWSEPLSISMPKYKPYINRPFLNFLEQYPLIYQLLQRLLKL